MVLNDLRRFLFYLFLSVSHLALNLNPSGAQDSRNGYWLPPYDTLRILLVFAEMENDPDDVFNTTGWQQGELPPDPGFLFDHSLLPGQEPGGIITRYYQQASFGRYIVLADYYPRMVSLDFSQARGNGFDQVVESVLAFTGDDIPTAHGFSLRNGDFDRLTTSSYGMLKPIEPDGYIDMVMVIWRVNSKITTTRSAGFCIPSNRTFPVKNMKGMNSYSTFVMKDYTSYTIVRHEFSHLLLGGNNFHTGGSGAGTKTFMSSAGGYSMLSSWDSYSQVYSAFDRRRLGWKHPDHRYQISAREPVSGLELNADLHYGQAFEHGSGDFLLRDFVLTGDVLRIELPYVRDSLERINPQWLWLENHQMKEGSIDHDERASRGIYAYIQVGKEALSGAQTYRGNCNYTWPLSAMGNFDILIDEENEEARIEDEWSNPFTGYNTLIRGAYDLGEKDGVIQRDELFLAKNTRINDRYPDSSVYSYLTYDLFGTGMDAFLPGDKIGLDRNPAAVPRLTFQTGYSRGSSSRSPVPSDNRRIHLNGLSVEMMDQHPDGSITVRVRWDDRNLGRDARWCGDLVLHENILIEKGVQVRIDQGRTPQKPTDPIRTNGEMIFAEPSSLTLKGSSGVHMEKRSRMILEGGSRLILEEGSRITMDRGSRIIIRDSARLQVDPGAWVSGTGRILAEGSSASVREAGGLSVKVRVR
jgi:hypothetical protein